MGLAVACTRGGALAGNRSDTVAFAPPADSAIGNDEFGRAVRRGRALLAHTSDSLPAYVGNALQCVSCHPSDGRQPDAMPWVGVYARYPQYRSRSASISLLTDRINDCFLRSLNGRALPADSREMRDMVTYMVFLSRGVPVGAVVRGQGLKRLALTSGDTARGATLFDSTCARCHGQRGEGTPVAPPVWGPRSYNIGAGMARRTVAAAFIRSNMPFDKPGSLTDQQAMDVASYIDAQARPDFAGKDADWPNGGAPADVGYQTDYSREHAGAVPHQR
jgi:thiosulfate dehydrogenase